MSTPIEPTGGHLPLETLADLDEGLLDGPQAGSAEQHLASCAACRTDLDDLRGLRVELADLGDRDTAAGSRGMPADVVAGLEAALAAQAGRDVAGRRSSPATVLPGDAPASVTALAPRTAHRRRSTQLLQVAAVLVVLLGLGGLGYTLVNSGSGSSTTAGSADSAASPGRASRGSEDSAGGTSAPTVVASGRDYSTATLRTAVGALTQVPKAASGSSGLNASSPPATASAPSGPLADPQKLATCLSDLGLAGPALGVDIATFEGKPAAVIVVPTAGDPTHLDVYAVAPSCPKGEPLSFVRVASP